MNEQIPERIGHYDIEEVLGTGGMSTVYRGIQPSLNRSVAIKVLPLQMAKEGEMIDRFEREAEIIAALNHPNIIQIFDRGTDGGSYYLVMEHVDGGSLHEIIHGRRLPIYEVVNIALQIARGLEFAHQKGVVHRDIKPSNILIMRDSGTVKITDFGIAKLAEAELSDRMLTREQVAMGTADYMSPEQKRDARHIDARTDVFSFGVLLYEMVSGRVPMGRFRGLHDLRDDTPPLLNQIALRCLQEDPADRYPSFTEIIADLNRLTQKGLVYREALDRMAESVVRVRRKAKTAISRGVTGGGGSKRTRMAGLTVAILVATITGVYLLVGAIRDRSGPAAPAAANPPADVAVETIAVQEEGPSKDEFATAEALIAEKKYIEALTVLRGIRTIAGEAKNTAEAADAQWLIANIHRQRGDLHSAGIAFGYFADTYADQADIAGDDRVAEAFYRAGMIKADEKDSETALRYLRTLRERYPNYHDGEKAMFREVTILDDDMKPSRRERERHRYRIVQACLSFSSRYPKSPRREEVLWRLSRVYLDLGGDENERKACDALEQMGRAFPTSVYLPYYEAAEIARRKIKDKARARRDYQLFLDANPGSDKAKKARDRLKRL